MTICPCGSGTPYSTCCGVFIEQNQYPSTPEQLMRSRYTAYVLANIDYIANTTQGVALREFNAQEARTFTESVKWVGLNVIQSSMAEDIGWVEFIASYQTQGDTHAIHEKSEFHRINNRWYYIDGKHYPSKKIKTGRNEPCPCGSQLKYKSCCANK